MFVVKVRREAQAIVFYYQTRNTIKRERDFNNEDANVLRFTCFKNSYKRDLENHIHGVVKQKFGTNGAFLRLCGRSPKDAEPLDKNDVFKRYSDELEKLKKEGF